MHAIREIEWFTECAQVALLHLPFSHFQNAFRKKNVCWMSPERKVLAVEQNERTPRSIFLSFHRVRRCLRERRTREEIPFLPLTGHDQIRRDDREDVSYQKCHDPRIIRAWQCAEKYRRGVPEEKQRESDAPCERESRSNAFGGRSITISRPTT